ncbi:reverse transcriptase domain, reverse transcriptase zinc-binding domain protein [Tanacetum coccineum]
MVRTITNEEIKSAMFDIGDDRAPGPDGFTSAFFKKAWDIIGSEVCEANKEFFLNGQLLKETNHTFIALIPKVPTPTRINDYHPISCCNVIYKCISKILTNHVIEGVKDVVSANQSAFIPGRNITDNILTTQELMHNYYLNKGTLRCAFKVDIHKAYETVDWRFLGTLPVKYLGVPLISSRLLNRDCKVLVESAKNIIGGIGIRSLKLFNKALMKKHIWNIVSNKESLWVRWIHFYKLKGHSLWAIPLNAAEMSWGWRKILQLCDLIRPFIWAKIGNGNSTSACRVADIAFNDGWVWPQDCLRKAPNLDPIQIPNLVANTADSYVWCDSNGNRSEFSVRCVWEAIRTRGNEVSLYHLVWFSHCVSRHAFHIWLVMQNNLHTQDKLRIWDINPNTNVSLLNCPFCGVQPDSHNHLFFECNFSLQVWIYVRHLANMELVSTFLQDIISYLQPIAKSRTANSIFGKLILAASSYYIWTERNNRLFKNVKRSLEELRDIIMVTVRLKLMTFTFKNTPNVIHLRERWKMPRSFRLYSS